MVCYKVSFCENFQRQSCEAFVGLTKCAQMVGGGHPLLPEILGQSEPPPSKTATSNVAFAHSLSVVTPSIITNRKSTTGLHHEAKCLVREMTSRLNNSCYGPRISTALRWLATTKPSPPPRRFTVFSTVFPENYRCNSHSVACIQ